jgi:UDP-N-acetylmuramyl pentapeptide phosphotransferase/UDP-N-acetylglucosamine-1-phosphate transferase
VIPDAASAVSPILFHVRRDWVAKSATNWQENHMTDRPQSRGGGIFLILAILIGAVIGTILGEPSLGVMGGTAAGIAIALLLWLRDRRRTGE